MITLLQEPEGGEGRDRDARRPTSPACHASCLCAILV